ncbi:hypothetical protein SBOR_6752 [Sclerotinia borealis F-4128]|uniref:Zn(2)-C6 fungal-type domain-containing protein n=1 Tax=Sclerotinia borealis (strain F-4128) TaxID=1432307 RepID=W9CDG7_SCLBF|nr:hypothetical protein SBOR_6752 [Sclerotinia borealis F-4128]
MGRTKTAPIDVSKLKSINGVSDKSSFGNFGDLDDEGDLVVKSTQEPPFVTFSNNGTISCIHPGHRKANSNDCIDFKSTWISQALTQEEEDWVAIDHADGASGERKCTSPREKVRAEQHERMRKYMGPSNEIDPRPTSLTNEVASYPKQIEFPPVDETINRLAIRVKGRNFNSRMSLLRHWQEYSDEVSRDRDDRSSTQELVDEVMDDVEVEQPNSSEENNYYLPPSKRPYSPTPPSRTASTTIESIRACTNCYERHVGCDRGLPGCFACIAIDANCVYPNSEAEEFIFQEETTYKTCSAPEDFMSSLIEPNWGPGLENSRR